MSDLELKTVRVPFSVTVQGVLKTEGSSDTDARQGAEEGLTELVGELNESGRKLFSDWTVDAKTGVEVETYSDFLALEAIRQMRTDLQSINESMTTIKSRVGNFSSPEIAEDMESGIDNIIALAGRIDNLLAKREAKEELSS